MGKCIVPYEKEYMDFLLVECGLEKETSIGYMKELRNFMEWLQNSGFTAEPEEVKVSHVRRYLSYLKNERGNSAVTRNNKLSTLKSYFHFLVIIDVIDEDENPLQYVKRAKVPEYLPVYLSLEEAEALLKASATETRTPERDYAIMQFFLQTGCRLGELLRVKLYDVSLEEKIVLIRGKGRRQRF